VWVKISGRAAVSSISSTAAALLICHNTAAVMHPVMVVLSHLKCERIYHGPKIKAPDLAKKANAAGLAKSGA